MNNSNPSFLQKILHSRRSEIVIEGQSANERVQKLVEALSTIYQYAFINVDVGEPDRYAQSAFSHGFCLQSDAYLNSVRTQIVSDVTRAILPATDLGFKKWGAEDKIAPEEAIAGNHTLDLAYHRLQKCLPDIRKRYSDFPALIRALDYVTESIESYDIKQFFRETLTPEKVHEFKLNSWKYVFIPEKDNRIITVKHSSIANAHENLERERVKEKLPQPQLSGQAVLS